MNLNFVFKQELGRLCPPLFFGVGQKSNFRVIISLFFFMAERCFHTKVTVFKKGTINTMENIF